MTKPLASIALTLNTDKKQSGYLEYYDRHFAHLRNLPIRLLELGVLSGGSLLLWHEYFEKGLIIGVDIAPNPLRSIPERIRFYQGSQDDSLFLDSVVQKCAPDGLDIIIDDASHIGTLARASFECLFMRHLKPGGIYVIEDWGTGYWSSWPDGALYQSASRYPSASKPEGDSSGSLPHPRGVDPNFPAHNFGMVGFIKELIDEVAWPDITHATRGNPNLSMRPSMIREIIVSFGLAFIVKT